jgi:hypothetical protein
MSDGEDTCSFLKLPSTRISPEETVVKRETSLATTTRARRFEVRPTVVTITRLAVGRQPAVGRPPEPPRGASISGGSC